MRHGIELETIADRVRGRVGGRPNLMEVNRCCLEMGRLVGFHGLVATRVEHAGRTVLTEIDAVVKAHQEGVSISEIFVSIRPACRVQYVIYIFPIIPALLLTSAGGKQLAEIRNIREDVIYIILCRQQHVSEGKLWNRPVQRTGNAT